MARIDPQLMNGQECGPSRWRILAEIVIPLSKSGIALRIMLS